MADASAVIVADAHLYHSPGSRSDTLFDAFLRHVPALGRHLIINGDLFEFWFEYGAVIPRRVFPTLARLAALRDQGITITLTGGNHDRWGGAFYREQLGATFLPNGGNVRVAGLNAHVEHGDGLTEEHRSAKIFHWLTRRRVTRTVFRAIHPDLGFWGVGKLSPFLGGGRRSEAFMTAGAQRQHQAALRIMKERRDLELLVLSHTHRAALVELEPGRWYVNPGPWMDAHRFAVVTSRGPELRVFEPEDERGV